jgi:hypothetical protein
MLSVVALKPDRMRDREYAQFMRECTQDRKHDECAARWHADVPSTVPVAMPVPMANNERE